MDDNTNRDDLTELLKKQETPVRVDLVALREARGWSQADLARRSGFDQGWLGHVESGRRVPSLGNAAKLADALGVSLDRLCCRECGADIDAMWRQKVAALLE